MHSTLFLASTLAMGVFSMPALQEREPRIVYETEVQTFRQTVVSYVTVNPTSTPTAAPTTAKIAAAQTPHLRWADWAGWAGWAAAKPSSTTNVRAVATSSTPAPATTSKPSTPSNSHKSGPEQAYLSAGPEYQAAILFHHNRARANHNAKPITWDASCEANARIAAQKCTFEHYIPPNARQGQNIWAHSSSFNVTAGITENWYKKELPPMMPYFGKSDVPNNVFHEVGHLTQMVWKGTTAVGCASVDCGSNMLVGGQRSPINKFTVCNYAPQGNIFGRFAENVERPIATTGLGSWTD